MRQTKTIIYINFAPYENAGYILDFLLDRYSTVLLFSFQFHKLADNRKSDKLIVYKNGSEIKSIDLFRAPTTSSLTFYLLPIRSLIIFAQLIYYIITLRGSYGPYDIYFTVNAFVAWIGNILKYMRIVKHTIFWVWDYYPLEHTDRIAVLMRWIYWQFDKPASLYSTVTIFLNSRLAILRKNMHIIPPNTRCKVVPIGTDPIKNIPVRSQTTLKFAFFGVLKKSQGLDLLFQADKSLVRQYKHIELHVIGGGPDLDYFKAKSASSPIKTTFHGYVADTKDVKKIISACHIGLACYIPEASNVSHYSDPSKIKMYLSCGVPVITTNVFSFSKDIKKSGSGRVIDYFKQAEFIEAVHAIFASQKNYEKRAHALSRRFMYRTIYPKLFSHV